MALLQLRHLTPHSLPFTPKLRHFHFSALKFPRFSFSASASTAMAKKVLVPIANGTEPMEAVITIDVLRRSGADVTVASVEKQLPVDACHGVKIVADALVVDCTNTIFDLIALPGGMPGATNLKNCGALESVVKKQAADGRLYAAVCASPAVALGSWGLLKGLKVIIIIDILRRAKANVVVASVGDNLEILASRKVKLVADMLLDEAAKLSYDLIVLPGGLGGAQAFANSDKLVNLLKKQMQSNKPYGAICASPALVLEPHGLLKGKKATAFPAMCNKLSDQSFIDNRVVVDGNLITSRGPGTAMEFALGIVEKFFGRQKALELAKVMLFVRQ
ncbi:Class I glutamine amidotransferase-like superfamily protein isoform 2 [Theobroma cacao]|uniref:Class I glutamine amidotransferase-like superfamily protein isoform 2 n=1 Tax=Theobroma cacao TaxID=3641 RepID=A0A061F7B6_THECC|nr:Class I glutamine amidotransferase-like superfamily protein isoform 2 [Theobroma cacao]